VGPIGIWDVVHKRANCLDNPVGRLTDATIPALDRRVYVGNTNLVEECAGKPIGQDYCHLLSCKDRKKWRDENLGFDGAWQLVEPLSLTHTELFAVHLGIWFWRIYEPYSVHKTFVMYPIMDWTEFTTGVPNALPNETTSARERDAFLTTMNGYELYHSIVGSIFDSCSQQIFRSILLHLTEAKSMDDYFHESISSAYAPSFRSGWGRTRLLCSSLCLNADINDRRRG
jgi:hypothetical protein